MKVLLPYILLLAALCTRAQDKVYFLDGSSKTGKILEIAPDYITVDVEGDTETLPAEKVLLLELKNGRAEIINSPTASLVINTKVKGSPKLRSSNDQPVTNLGSVNALALCNADISGFYERLLPNRKIGLGLMGAYNFNNTATISNLFIAVLDNAKKKYDLGAFINIYIGGLKPHTSLYYGMMLKYMNFDFTSVIEEQVTVGNTVSTNIKYRPASGYQLATLITGGTHTNLGHNFFIRTLLGLGGFNMHGDYRQQFNYMLNQSNRKNSNGATTVTHNQKFLGKLYVGVNLGFSF